MVICSKLCRTSEYAKYKEVYKKNGYVNIVGLKW